MSVATERKKLDDALEREQRLRAQLAAERERAEKVYADCAEQIVELEAKLATERDEYTTSIAEHSMRLNELREQLATAVEALKFYAQDRGYGSIHERARAALAKVGK